MSLHGSPPDLAHLNGQTSDDPEPCPTCGVATDSGLCSCHGSQRGGLIPVRMTLDFTLAMSREDYDNGLHFDRVEHALADLDDVFGAGGHSAAMDPDDVIRDSPLDRYLKANGS